MEWQKIYLQPMELNGPRVLEVIAAAVEKKFDAMTKRLGPIPVPAAAYDQSRNQYCSTVILKNLYLRLPADALRLLAVTDVDLFVPQFNYVFGQAAVDGKVSIISLHRLHPEYYGDPPNQELFERRAIIEAVHELGHTFGLRHCRNPRCVMFFSHNVEDTDRKTDEFCDECGQLQMRPVTAEVA